MLYTLNTWKFKNKANNQDIVKFIAILSMIIDHLGYFYFHDCPLYRAIGRPSIAIFSFFAGYNFKNINLKILIYGMLMTVCLSLLQQNLQINVLITYLLGHIFFYYCKNNDNFLNACFLLSILLSVFYFQLSVIEYRLIPLGFMICGLRAKKGLSFKIMLLPLFVSLLVLAENTFNFSVQNLTIIVFLYLASYFGLCMEMEKENKYKIFLISRFILDIYFWHFIIFMSIFLVMHAKSFN